VHISIGCLASGYKSRLLVSLRALMTEGHYLKCLLGCIRRNNNDKNVLISVFRLDFRRSLDPGLLARAPFLNSGW